MTRAVAATVCAVVVIGCVKSRPDDGASDAAIRPVPAATSTAAGRNVEPAAFSVTQCETVLVEAEQKLAKAKQELAAKCTKDTDCILASGSACFDDCPSRAISKDGSSAYEAVAKSLAEGHCKEWRAGGCPTTTPKPKPACVPLRAACENGVCTALGQKT